jgi:hypothetical protein
MNVKTIYIKAKTWFDKVNGNSYFSAVIILNYEQNDESSLSIPFEYGYWDQYIDSAKDLLFKEGVLKDFPDRHITPLWRYCQDNNICLRTSIEKRCLKREVVAWGLRRKNNNTNIIRNEV